MQRPFPKVPPPPEAPETPEAPQHVPVLPSEVLDLLAPAPGQTVLDGTVGRGGHAALIIPKLGLPEAGLPGLPGAGGRYIALDVDPGNVDFARRRLEPIAAAADVTLHVLHRSFARAPEVLKELGLESVDGLLADLGFASNQMDDPARGFAFSDDGPLDMRLDPTLAGGESAADLVNELPERDLADLIYQYGEERLSRRIARKIVEARAARPIQTTGELAELVRRAYGPAGRKQRIHPATRTFMALRIAVNDELGALDRLLEAAPGILEPGGRMAVISFHSLEDRRVKQRFLAWEQAGEGRRLTRKPLTPTEDEMMANPRSRSAKLRGFEKIGS